MARTSLFQGEGTGSTPVGAIFLFLLFLFSFCSKTGKWEIRKLVVGNETLIVEIADSPSKWERGLKYRDTLAENAGMFFIFPQDGFHPFWMKDTKIPLDIAFIDKNFYILDIDSMTPFDTLQLHFAQKPFRYALEVNKGWFKKHGIKKGTRIFFLQSKEE